MMKRSNIQINPNYSPKVMGALASSIATYGFPDATEIIHEGRNIIATLKKAGLCIKAYGIPNFVKGYYYSFFRDSKAKRAYKNAMRLLELGVSTPEPVFYIENFTKTRRLRRSYYVCKLLMGYREIRSIEKRPDFPELTHALAEFLLSLHLKGIYMEDCTPGNIMFRKKDEGGYDFMLVDINRMRFDVKELSTLLTNFRALLNTREGTVAVAREYSKLLAASPSAEVIPDLEEFVGQMYDKHQERLQYKRRLKKMLRLSRK